MVWLIGPGAIVVFLVAVACVYLMKMRRELQTMAPVDSGEIAENIFAVKDGYVNLYLIGEGDRYVAIDAGKNRGAVKKELSRIGISPAKVDAVLLTHTDRDHVGSLALFENATVYMSEAEETLLDGTRHRVFVFDNKITGPYVTLGDNTDLAFGDVRVRTVLTPGHTPGSMCYLVNDRFLFTGDTLSLRDGEADVFVRFFNMDTRGQMRSLRKISSLPAVEYVFTGHHGYTDRYATALGKWKG